MICKISKIYTTESRWKTYINIRLNDKTEICIKKRMIYTICFIQISPSTNRLTLSLVSEASQWWLQRSATVCLLPSHQQNPWNPSKHFLKLFYSNCLSMNLKNFINDCFCPILSVGSLILSFTPILI